LRTTDRAIRRPQSDATLRHRSSLPVASAPSASSDYSVGRRSTSWGSLVRAQYRP
jgi:hypothetical protein